jgi:23S rRNA (uracil1939-C5)-methyltransferase
MSDETHTPSSSQNELPRKPWVGLELTVEPTALSPQGLGRAELELLVGPQRAPRRYTIDVRGALPGERARVCVISVKRRQLMARLIELERGDARRRPARCRHFGSVREPGRGCGGCALQHLDHAAQLALKLEQLQRLFAAQGLDGQLLRVPLAPPEPWYYRNKMEYSFAVGQGGELDLGLHPPGYRHEVLSLDECHLLSPLASALLPRLRAWAREQGLRPLEFPARRRRDAPSSEPERPSVGWLRTLTLREGKRSGERMLELCTTDDDEAMTARGPRPADEVAQAFADTARAVSRELGGDLASIYWTQQRTRRGEPTRLIEHHLGGAPTLTEELHLPAVGPLAARQLRFEIHPRAFFQPNTLQAEVLYTEVLRAAFASAEGSRWRALDLYCGTGTIALCLAPACEQVIGVELSAEAVENARRNALANAIDNVVFHAGDAGKLLERELAGERGQVDLVVVDPPRSGLMPAAMEHLGRIGAPRLVYVSCNPESLARDLLMLRRRGLEARYVQPVDMFPHTGHIENVALLERQ